MRIHDIHVVVDSNHDEDWEDDHEPEEGVAGHEDDRSDGTEERTGWERSHGDSEEDGRRLSTGTC